MTRVMVSAAVTDRDYHGETGLPIHSGSGEHAWITGDPLGHLLGYHLLGLHWPMIKVDGKS